MRTPVGVLVTLLLLCGFARAQPLEPDLRTDRTGWFKAQIRCAAVLAHTEAGNQDDRGQRMVVWVAAQRALENRPYWGGGTICKVAYHQRITKKGETVSEFTGVHNPPNLPEGHAALVRAEWNARAVLLGEWKPAVELQSARFYQNPVHADPSRSRWFEKKLHELGAVGDHIFYREKGPG